MGVGLLVQHVPVVGRVTRQFRPATREVAGLLPGPGRTPDSEHDDVSGLRVDAARDQVGDELGSRRHAAMLF